MKKCGVLIVIGMLIALNLNAGPAPVPIELSEGVSVVKIDDKTCKMTTIKTTKVVAELDKAELQTENDHIPDRIAELQTQIDGLNDRSAEINAILEVFK